jgi:uncharacterized membrane protein YhaH (DUF805 family)
MSTAPGWYDDGAGQLRWWDGYNWTEHVQQPAGMVGAGGQYAGVGAQQFAAPPRSFREAIEVCFSKYATFQGRASRSEYWYWTLFVVLVAVVSALFELGVGSMSSSDGVVIVASLLNLAISLALILPGLAVAVRRMHDIGKSGWNLFWALLPLVGGIVLLVYTVRPGEPHANQYG